MISKECWERIAQMAATGRSISAIARELDLDRKTVRAGLRKQQWAPYRREQSVTLLLAPYQTWLKERAPKVNYSARILFQELQQQGYCGSYDTVKLAVRPLRSAGVLVPPALRPHDAAPGQQAPVDRAGSGLQRGTEFTLSFCPQGAHPLHRAFPGSGLAVPLSLAPCASPLACDV